MKHFFLKSAFSVLFLLMWFPEPQSSWKCLIIPFVFFFRSCYDFSWERLFFAGPWMVHKGKGCSFSDRREVLKAKRLKIRRSGEEARRSPIMERALHLGTVPPDNRQSSAQTKMLKKNSAWDLISFCIWPRSIPGGIFFWLLSKTVMLLWPFEAITATKMGKGGIILQYLQINIVTHGFVLLVQIL